MGRLLIKGHYCFGNSIISKLKDLGGKLGSIPITGNDNRSYYFLMKDNTIGCTSILDKADVVLNITDFYEKFPFKLGDLVYIQSDGEYDGPYKIIYMRWSDEHNEVFYGLLDLEFQTRVYPLTTDQLIEI